MVHDMIPDVGRYRYSDQIALNAAGCVQHPNGRSRFDGAGRLVVSGVRQDLRLPPVG